MSGRGGAPGCAHSFYEYNREFTEAQRVAKLNEWVRSQESEEEAWKQIRMRYRCSQEALKKVMTGEKEGAIAFWYIISRLIKTRLVFRHKFQGEHSVKRFGSNQMPWAETHKTKPLTDFEWVSRNLDYYGDAAVTNKMLKSGKLLAELEQAGYKVKTRIDSTGEPILEKIKEVESG